MKHEWSLSSWRRLERRRIKNGKRPTKVYHDPNKCECARVFRCHGAGSCGRIFGMCLGGDKDEADPAGTLCCDCWSARDKKLRRRSVA